MLTSCPRCNKESESKVIRAGSLFEGKYEIVCLDCADNIDIEAASAAIQEATPHLTFNVFGLLDPESERGKRQIRSQRAYSTIQNAHRAIERLSKAIEKRKKKNEPK